MLLRVEPPARHHTEDSTLSLSESSPHCLHECEGLFALPTGVSVCMSGIVAVVVV